jgi:hypothetical protein
MNHKKLSKLSEEEMKYEIIESKRCLQENGFNVTSFSFPYNDGDNNKKIEKIIADKYYIARTATESLMFFQVKITRKVLLMMINTKINASILHLKIVIIHYNQISKDIE